MKQAKAHYFCPWCLCTKAARAGLSTSWRNDDVQRNQADPFSATACRHCSERSECPDTSHGQNGDSLLAGIFDSDCVVLDVLHAFLRFTDVVQNLFLEHVIIKYGCEKEFVAICQAQNINWHPTGTREDGYQDWTTLQGPDKRKLFSWNFPIHEVLSHSNIPTPGTYILLYSKGIFTFKLLFSDLQANRFYP